jgi:hypothetical protein
MKLRLLASALLLPALTLAAHATTITFSGAPNGVFTGSVTESGYIYSLFAGDLFINTDGHPGNNVETGGGVAGPGGVLDIESAVSGGIFNFSSLDLASILVGSITVSGYLNGSLVATDVFAGPNMGIPGPYITETATDLTNLTELRITFPAPFEAGIDNVVVNAPVSGAVPEPSSIALLGTGALALAGALRRRLLA